MSVSGKTVFKTGPVIKDQTLSYSAVLQLYKLYGVGTEKSICHNSELLGIF